MVREEPCTSIANDSRITSELRQKESEESSRKKMSKVIRSYQDWDGIDIDRSEKDESFRKKARESYPLPKGYLKMMIMMD